MADHRGFPRSWSCDGQVPPDAGTKGYCYNKGDPGKAAAAIYGVVEMEEPPLRLLLGSDALKSAERKIALLQTDFKRMEAITLSTDFNN